ncbi:MAG TPA: 30S ribosomal protein S12 methylthiotransferase RimO [Bryobacterales bacterium]|nr:30S ribosomal protein S12 methylthiotransferase RimO [Bryobacterales bacterium]
MKIGFVSLGCPKNLVDSEVMMGLVAARGHELTPRASEADVLVVNTCSFIQPAQQESVNTILEMATHKKTGRARKLIVAGCLVERYRDEIRREIPEVDAVIGTNDIARIVELCEQSAADGFPAPAEPAFAEPYLYHELTPRVRATPPHMAYIKIAEGCDHPCSFCVIPQFRGRFRSRRWESVVAEARRLFEEGVSEITLIGQDTTCFGEDYGMKDGLAFLLERLAKLDNAGWIRVLYVYPNKVTGRLLDTIAAHEALCKYIDVPLQHASARVLRRMKRGGSGDIFLKLLERMRRAIPGVALRTSMIAGFPGETAQDFDELCQFVEAAQFDHLGVFSYSDEATSASWRLDGKVDARTIYHRKRKLLAVQRRISRARGRARVGQTLPILVEGPSRETDLLWEGRLAGQAAEIDGKTYINDFEGPPPQPGMFGRVRITESRDYDLIGTLLGERESRPRPAAQLLRVLQ